MNLPVISKERPQMMLIRVEKAKRCSLWMQLAPVTQRRCQLQLAQPIADRYLPNPEDIGFLLSAPTSGSSCIVRAKVSPNSDLAWRSSIVSRLFAYSHSILGIRISGPTSPISTQQKEKWPEPRSRNLRSTRCSPLFSPSLKPGE